MNIQRRSDAEALMEKAALRTRAALLFLDEFQLEKQRAAFLVEAIPAALALGDPRLAETLLERLRPEMSETQAAAHAQAIADYNNSVKAPPKERVFRFNKAEYFIDQLAAVDGTRFLLVEIYPRLYAYFSKLGPLNEERLRQHFDIAAERAWAVQDEAARRGLVEIGFYQQKESFIYTLMGIGR